MEDSPQQRRLNGLKKRQQKLTEKLNRLEMDYDDETDVTRKMHAEQEIDNTKQTLSEIEEDITTLEATLAIAPLLQRANKAATNQNYTKAMECWREILVLQDDYPLAASTLAELEDKARYQTQAQQLMRELGSPVHIDALKPIWNDLFAQLRTPSSSDTFASLINITTDYCADKMSAENFMFWFNAAVQQIPSAPQTQPTSQALTGIARRIQQGNMVLFLGSDIAKHYYDDCLNEQQVAQQLAQQAQYDDFNGSLAVIAEYYQAQAGMGTGVLLERLQQHLPKHQQGITLYHHLAKTSVPQVIMTTVYDDLLEQTFLAANKPFVRLSAFINKTAQYQVGHVHVHYSDKPDQDEILFGDELLTKHFTRQGYSVIYKMRGTCNQHNEDDLNALVLTERQFFDLARCGQDIMPRNLSTEIRSRGFLFLGYRPRSWDDRLLVKILFEEHQNGDGRCHVLTQTTDPLEINHWEHHSVIRHPFDLGDLDACLAGDEA